MNTLTLNTISAAQRQSLADWMYEAARDYESDGVLEESFTDAMRALAEVLEENSTLDSISEDQRKALAGWVYEIVTLDWERDGVAPQEDIDAAVELAALLDPESFNEEETDMSTTFTLPTYGGITLRPGAACAAYNINTAMALRTDPVTFWRSQIAQKRTEITQYEALLEAVRTSGPTLGHLMRYVAWETGVWDLEFCQEDDDYFPADYTFTISDALEMYNDREEDVALMDGRDEWDSMDLVEFTQRIAGDPLAVMILAFADKLDPAQQITLTSEQSSKLYGFLFKRRNDLKANLADLLDTLAATEEARVVA